MDIFITTVIFFIFLIISFYLGVIRMSAPLLIIYSIYFFIYLINKDVSSINKPIISKNEKNNNYQPVIPNAKNTIDINDQNISKENVKTPRPVVSYTPKPIKIDSNIIIQKETNKKLKVSINSNKDSLKTSIIEENNSIEKKNTLELNEIMICRGVYKRNPIKPGYNFINNVDSLFCYTKISNSGPKQEIKHVWFFEDKEISSVVYNIKTSYNYRSWSKKTIYPKQTGNWRVDVIDASGNILGTRDFSVKSINNSY